MLKLTKSLALGGGEFVAANEKFVDEILGGPDEACLLCLFLHAAVCIPICILDGPEKCLACIKEYAPKCLEPCGKFLDLQNIFLSL